MHKVVFLIVLCVFLGGCKISELTPEEKKKISDLTEEVVRIEKNIATTEKELSSERFLRVASVKKSRVETDKLTVSILKQRIAAIESGAKIEVMLPAISANESMAASLAEEIKQADIALHKTNAESSLYSGGAIKGLIDIRAELEKLLITSLNQKYLSAKYGLYVPDVDKDLKDLNENQNGDKSKPVANEKTEIPQDHVMVNDQGPFDFRKTRWGMSQDDVRKREATVPTLVAPETLTYNENINGNKVTLMYLFDDGKLWRCVYTLNENFSNKNKHVDTYFDFVSLMKEKYGPPNSEDTFWSKDLYKKDYNRRGMAYSTGDVSSQASWKTEKTGIFTRIEGNNYEIDVRIFFSSIELEEKFRQKEKEKENSKF